MTTSKPSKGKIIVFGILFWYPLAGVTFQFLHYLIGLRRLGYDPYYVEDSGRYVYDHSLNDSNPDATRNIEAVAPTLEAHGFADRWAYRGYYPGGRCYGMTEEQILALYNEADAFLNVTGAQEIREEHSKIGRRIYVESDPVASQIKVHNGDAAMIEALAAHDTHFTFGENLGATDSLVPVERFRWLPTRQPVLLDFWSDGKNTSGSSYTTIANWHTKGKDVTYLGDTYYWSKDREFMKVLDLPLKRDVPFELAMSVDPEVTRLLSRNGWILRDPLMISSELDAYRNFIFGSRAAFTVAKDQNVRLRSGWFSDRSACYLAGSKPVIDQDTAFGNTLPTGCGLFAFKTMDDILSAVDEIEGNYRQNQRAAREIAAEYFAAEKVLGSLMERAGL